MGGKGKKGGRGGNKYVHNHTYNPVARESDERKIERLHSMEVKRYQNYVDRNMKVITQYLPLDTIAYKKKKIDPMFHLKGAARPAQEFYRPPDFQEDVEPVDLTVTYKGRLWEHEAEECRDLLRSMSELSAAMHNVKGKTNDAILVLKQMIQLDTADHMFARHRLLRCYLDQAEAGEARALLDKYPDEPYCCFAYSRALIECIALLLEESDASVDLVDAALTKAYDVNPYGLWTIALHGYFAETVEHADRIKDTDVEPHSVIDAIRFFDVDVPLWVETEGAVQHVKDYIVHYKLTPPSSISLSVESDDDEEEGNEEIDDEESAIENEDEDGDDDEEKDIDKEESDKKREKRKFLTENDEEKEKEKGTNRKVEQEDEEDGNSDFEMFIGMYETAIEMAADDDKK